YLQQALALVEPHRFHADPGSTCHLSNREDTHLCHLLQSKYTLCTILQSQEEGRGNSGPPILTERSHKEVMVARRPCAVVPPRHQHAGLRGLPVPQTGFPRPYGSLDFLLLSPA